MNFSRQWRSGRLFERGVLWTTLALCSFVAAKPLRERFVAWQDQRTLEAQWQHAVQKSRASSDVKTVALKPRPSTRASKRTAALAKREEQIMWPLVRLRCSRIGLDAIVVQGTSEAQLRRGPGHETGTSFPGGPNCVIAAHRNAYGWWFYRLNSLRVGDTIVLETPERRLVYRVAVSRKVLASDTSILHIRAKAAPRLTLYTCTLPKTESRLVVTANLHSMAS